MCCFFQAEDGIRDLVRSRGLGDVYKRQLLEVESGDDRGHDPLAVVAAAQAWDLRVWAAGGRLSLIHI